MGTIPPARIRGPPCRLRLSFHTREAPKVRTFAGRYGKCDHLLFKAFFPPGRWSLTSLPDGERLASKPGTRACERDGRSVPTRVTPSVSVPSAPPPKVEVKGRSPERKPFWYNPSASHSLGTVPLAASLSHKGGLVSYSEKNCKKQKQFGYIQSFAAFVSQPAKVRTLGASLVQREVAPTATEGLFRNGNLFLAARYLRRS